MTIPTNTTNSSKLQDSDVESGSTSTESQSDETGEQKSYYTILQQEIREGVNELERPARGLCLSGVSAGLDVGFSVLAIGTLGSLAAPDQSELTEALLRANAYAVGFIFVIFGRSELFTEHTTLAVLPLLDGQSSLSGLGRLWGLVYGGNLIGVLIFSAVIAIAGPALDVIEPKVLEELAHHLVRHDWWVTLMSAVLAGWLMGLVSWLVTAGRDTISEIFFVWLVTGLIGLAGLHHCILGSAEVLSAMFSGADVSVFDFVRFLFLATVGNIVGGIFFVAIVKYGHASSVRPGLLHIDPQSTPTGPERGE